MKLRKNVAIERAGVNATQTFFETERCVFQEIDLRNDYGKDAYVDRGDNGEVTGLCVALQIKSGKKYKRAEGYAIPVEGHERVWRRTTLPIAGVVHDRADGSLHWVNISEYLAQHPEPVTVIPVPKESILTSASLRAKFWPSMQATAAPGFGHAVLALITHDLELQQSAVLDCFAAGRSDARVLVIVRHLLATFTAESLQLAVRVLSFCTPHPDVAWSDTTWVPQHIKEEIRQTFRWTDDEIIRLLASAEYEDWRRGGAGQNAFQLLVEDPDVSTKVERVVPRAFDISSDVGSTALAVALHLAYDDARGVYDALVGRDSRVRDVGGIDEIERVLREFGCIDIF